MARLIVVSNRLVGPDQGSSAGGLAVGLLAALRGAEGGVWFGWSGKTQKAPSAEPEVHEKEGIRVVTIDLPSANFDAYYDGFCNGSLWPLHHYFPGAFRYDAAEFEAHMAINRRFAEALMKLLQEGDVIWVHDYHLIPLGSLLRHAGVRSPIGFFLHIPYPNVAVLRLLPNYAELVRDMCHGALLVNPYDKAAVARALAMPLAERRSRHEGNLKVLHANSISRWHESFMSRFAA